MKRVLFKLVWWIFFNLVMVLLVWGILGYIGVWDMEGYLDIGREWVGGVLEEEGEGKVEDIYLLEKEELEKKRKNLELREELLEVKEVSLKEVQKGYEGLMLQLKVKSDQLDVREERLRAIENEKEDRDRNIKDIASKIGSMRPGKAIERLEGLDLLLVIDIFRQMDKDAELEGRVSIVSFLLSEMDKEKAQEIIRLKSRFPGEGLGE